MSLVTRKNYSAATLGLTKKDEGFPRLFGVLR